MRPFLHRTCAIIVVACLIQGQAVAALSAHPTKSSVAQQQVRFTQCALIARVLHVLHISDDESHLSATTKHLEGEASPLRASNRTRQTALVGATASVLLAAAAYHFHFLPAHLGELPWTKLLSLAATLATGAGTAIVGLFLEVDDSRYHTLARNRLNAPAPPNEHAELHKNYLAVVKRHSWLDQDRPLWEALLGFRTHVTPEEASDAIAILRTTPGVPPAFVRNVYCDWLWRTPGGPSGDYARELLQQRLLSELIKHPFSESDQPLWDMLRGKTLRLDLEFQLNAIRALNHVVGVPRSYLIAAELDILQDSLFETEENRYTVHSALLKFAQNRRSRHDDKAIWSALCGETFSVDLAFQGVAQRIFAETFETVFQRALRWATIAHPTTRRSNPSDSTVSSLLKMHLLTASLRELNVRFQAEIEKAKRLPWLPEAQRLWKLFLGTGIPVTTETRQLALSAFSHLQNVPDEEVAEARLAFAMHARGLGRRHAVDTTATFLEDLSKEAFGPRNRLVWESFFDPNGYCPADLRWEALEKFRDVRNVPPAFFVQAVHSTIESYPRLMPEDAPDDRLAKFRSHYPIWRPGDEYVWRRLVSEPFTIEEAMKTVSEYRSLTSASYPVLISLRREFLRRVYASGKLPGMYRELVAAQQLDFWRSEAGPYWDDLLDPQLGIDPQSLLFALYRLQKVQNVPLSTFETARIKLLHAIAEMGTAESEEALLSYLDRPLFKSGWDPKQAPYWRILFKSSISLSTQIKALAAVRTKLGHPKEFFEELVTTIGAPVKAAIESDVRMAPLFEPLFQASVQHGWNEESAMLWHLATDPRLYLADGRELLDVATLPGVPEDLAVGYMTRLLRDHVAARDANIGAVRAYVLIKLAARPWIPESKEAWEMVCGKVFSITPIDRENALVLAAGVPDMPPEFLTSLRAPTPVATTSAPPTLNESLTEEVSLDYPFQPNEPILVETQSRAHVKVAHRLFFQRWNKEKSEMVLSATPGGPAVAFYTPEDGDHIFRIPGWRPIPQESIQMEDVERESASTGAPQSAATVTSYIGKTLGALPVGNNWAKLVEGLLQVKPDYPFKEGDVLTVITNENSGRQMYKGQFISATDDRNRFSLRSTATKKDFYYYPEPDDLIFTFVPETLRQAITGVAIFAAVGISAIVAASHSNANEIAGGDNAALLLFQPILLRIATKRLRALRSAA